MSAAADRNRQVNAVSQDNQRFHELVQRYRQRIPAPGAATAPPRSTAQAPAVPAAPAPAVFERELLAGVPRWQLAVRREARKQARIRARREHERLLAVHQRRVREVAEEASRADRERSGEQRLLNHAHERLMSGDPLALAAAVAERTRSPWYRVTFLVDADTVLLGVHVSDVESVVPEHEPSRTATGKATTKKRSKGVRNDLYAEAICAMALTAARQALTAAPSLTTASVVVLSSSEPIAYCTVPAGAWSRWSNLDAVTAFYDCDGIVQQAGRARDVVLLGPDHTEAFSAAARIHAGR